jgi:hypothetical protein
MTLRRLIASLVAVLVIAGLAVAPLATPASAMATAHAGMADMASMSADMPCCPDDIGTACPDCPLAAICVLKITPAAPVLADTIPMRLSSKTAHVLHNDAPSRGLNLPPPDQPPRSLV